VPLVKPVHPAAGRQPLYTAAVDYRTLITTDRLPTTAASSHPTTVSSSSSLVFSLFCFGAVFLNFPCISILPSRSLRSSAARLSAA